MDSRHKRFCPKCGATDAIFFRGFCLPCYKKMHSTEAVSMPAKVAVERCPTCGRYFHKNRMLPSTYNSLQEIVASYVKTALFDPVVNVDKGHEKALVDVAGFLDERKAMPYREEREITLLERKRACETCSRLAGDYYEVKVQVRRRDGTPQEKYDKALIWMRHELRKMRPEDDRAHALRERATRDGSDLYFVHHEVGDELLKRIGNKYHVKSLHSTRLGRKGRTKHTYSVRV